jgi:hypothetical protein
LSAYWAAWSQDSADQVDSSDTPASPGHRGSLIDRYRKVDPKLDAIKRAAAEDVAKIQEDDKFFGRANEDEL